MKLLFTRKKSTHKTQMELKIKRPKEPDRNHKHGGRSFYFFDFDDNIAFLQTPVYLFHNQTGQSVKLSSGEYAQIRKQIGAEGPYQNYQLNFDDASGSFQSFRDKKRPQFLKYLGLQQNFVDDVQLALARPDFEWKGPSWSCFFHAVYNQRPISLITARGHHPGTIIDGIKQFVKLGHLPYMPNVLDIFPVNHPNTQIRLGYEFSEENDVAELKKHAIRKSVEKAFEEYGENPYHRFGMSDDDPKNLQLIMQAMVELKRDYPKNKFFVISTSEGQFIKKEIFTDHTEDEIVDYKSEQLSLI